jgi:hypothetical protein
LVGQNGTVHRKGDYIAGDAIDFISAFVAVARGKTLADDYRRFGRRSVSLRRALTCFGAFFAYISAVWYNFLIHRRLSLPYFF